MEIDDMVKLAKKCSYCGATSLYRRVRMGGFLSFMLRSRISEADKFIPVLTQFIYNWCQDFEMELANAAVEDKSYYEKRIKYCQDFLRIFPDSD